VRNGVRCTVIVLRDGDEVSSDEEPKVKRVCVLMILCVCPYALVCMSLTIISCVLVLTRVCPHQKGDKDDKEKEDDEEEEEDEKTTTVCSTDFI